MRELFGRLKSRKFLCSVLGAVLPIVFDAVGIPAELAQTSQALLMGYVGCETLLDRARGAHAEAAQ